MLIYSFQEHYIVSLQKVTVRLIYFTSLLLLFTFLVSSFLIFHFFSFAFFTFLVSTFFFTFYFFSLFLLFA